MSSKDRIEVYKDVDGQWRWTGKSANNRKMGNSGEGYNNYDDCVDAFYKLKKIDLVVVKERDA